MKLFIVKYKYLNYTWKEYYISYQYKYAAIIIRDAFIENGAESIITEKEV